MSNTLNILNYLTGASDEAPAVSTLTAMIEAAQESQMAEQEVTQEAETFRAGRERLAFAIIVAQYAMTPSGSASPELLLSVYDEAFPLSADKNIRKNYKSTVKAALALHAERFTPANNADEAATVGEALAFARGVEIRKAAKERAASNKQAKEAKEASLQAAKEAFGIEAPKADPILAQIEALNTALQTLMQSNDPLAQAALKAAHEALKAHHDKATVAAAGKGKAA